MKLNILNIKITPAYRVIAIGLILSSAVFISCEDELNVDPRDSISEEDFLKDPKNAVQLINGVYNKMLDYDMNSFSWIGITSITSDDADKGSTSGDSGTDKKKLDDLTFDATDVSFNDVWRGRYAGIYRANTAIFYLNQVELDQSLKDRLIGEAEFLRAMWYFDLVRCFGGVPVVLGNIDLNDTDAINSEVFTKKTKEEVYAQIEIDLKNAINKLPLKSGYGPTDVGRATKGAAQALLAKAYLYQKRWQEAFDMSGEVISSGQYSLLTDYAQVWRETGENGSESIFEVQATAALGINGYTDVQGPRGTPDLGWGFNIPSENLVNAYEAGDIRKAATIMFVPSVLWDGFVAPTSWTNPRYNYKAYQSSIAETWISKGMTGKNLRILKYSDVLLIRAEAAFQNGNTGEATDRINEIRNRAGLDDLGTVTLAQIYKERRLEMAMEHDRWFDIVRTGQAPTAMAAVGKTFIVGTHEVFPIPQPQITVSGGKLIQNNGY